MRNRNYIILSAFALILVVLSFGFQNCGGPMPDTGTASDPSLTSKSVIDAPFAYDITLNQISFMSCHQSPCLYASGSQATQSVLPSGEKCAVAHTGFTNTNALKNPGVFFTWRAGAYGSNAGLQLNSTFTSYANTNFVKKGAYDSAQIQEALSTSTANSGVQLQLATRGRNNLVNAGGYLKTSEQTTDTWLWNMLAPLNSDHITSVLKTAFNQKHNYFPSGGYTLNDKIIEGSLFANDTSSGSIIDQSGYIASLRDSSSSATASMLTATFTKDGNSIVADSTGKYPNHVYGRGFVFNFAAPTRGGTVSSPASSLSSSVLDATSGVKEIDLATNSPVSGANWSCPYQYMIVDKNTYNSFKSSATPASSPCPEFVYSSATPAQKAEYDIVARHLSISNWMINPVKRCVVYTHVDGFDCYQNSSYTTSEQDIEYTDFTRCNPSSGTNPSTNKPYYIPGRVCADFLTVCIRP